MTRTIGAKDKQKRKRRSDIGKLHKTFRGRPAQHKPKKRYNRVIGNKDSIWLRAYYRVPMSKDGYRNWNYKVRHKIYKEVTNMKMSPTFRNVPLNEVNSKSKFEDFFARNLWQGKFVIMGGSHGKTKSHFKPVSIATIIIKETPEGNVARIIKSTRLHRYRWFMKS